MADFLLPFPLMALSILPGAESLSAFRAERLLARLRVHAPALRTLRCRDFYLVDADNTAESDLRRLLGPGPAAFDAAGLSLFVVPRVGTLSPWSSKATDIAKVCGLAGDRTSTRLNSSH